jgi:hypothetical protein
MMKPPNDHVMELYELVDRLGQNDHARMLLATILRRIQHTAESIAGHRLGKPAPSAIAELLGRVLEDFDRLPAEMTTACNVDQFLPRARTLCAELLMLARPIATMPETTRIEAFEREAQILLLNLPETRG